MTTYFNSIKQTMNPFIEQTWSQAKEFSNDPQKRMVASLTVIGTLSSLILHPHLPKYSELSITRIPEGFSFSIEQTSILPAFIPIFAAISYVTAKKLNVFRNAQPKSEKQPENDFVPESLIQKAKDVFPELSNKTNDEVLKFIAQKQDLGNSPKERFQKLVDLQLD